MGFVSRVFDPAPVLTLDKDEAAGRGLAAARRLGAAGVLDDVEASGLRGRGGAGFPTGRKWRTVAENRSPAIPTTVVVNGAEGEPGSFKDRTILRCNPFRVLEGALVAAFAVGADRVVVALKDSFHTERKRVGDAIEAVRAAGWADGVDLSIATGPPEYLFGEETALLEVLDGRQPFPRVAPPFRHGVDEIGDGTESAADVDMAGTDPAAVAPPTLINNVETLANVPPIMTDGPAWFREVGTDASPGSVVCTVTGQTRRHGVGEFPRGTPLSQVIDELGGGPAGSRVVAVLSGVAHPLIPESMIDTPLTYETMEEIGAGLGAAGFIVFDDTADLVAVAQGVSRFLAIESCGQCTPCKQDGLELANLLDGLRRSDSGEGTSDAIAKRVSTVADGARCFLAHQHERVVGSLLRLFPDVVRAHESGQAPEAPVELIAPIVELDGQRAVLDERHLSKQPDWTFDEAYSGQSPADRIDQRAGETD
jgi:NADH-quinone oxidoreductase subunit F